MYHLNKNYNVIIQQKYFISFIRVLTITESLEKAKSNLSLCTP